MTRSPTAVDSPSMGGGYLDLRLGELLERLSADGLAPGGGSAAALTVAFSARLVAMVARCSVHWDEAGGVSAQANAIGERAVELAHTDGRVWEDALTALRNAETGAVEDPKRDFALEQKLEAAAAAPLEIASLGADAAALAALAAEHGDATYRADAAAAAALAAGGASAAAHLVRVNLGVRSADPRLAPRTRERTGGARRCGTAARVPPVSRYATLTDAELVRLCRADDAGAWNELVERYSRYVYAIAVRGFRLSDEDAEDVFQDVFTRIYTRLDSLRDDSALRPWIAQLTRRRCLDVVSARRDTPSAEEVLAEEGSST